MGVIYAFVRSNGRCPASDFLAGLQGPFRKKFQGSFDALSKMGAEYYISQRFKALIGDGKPLWEFKEHDHRLYCERRVIDGKRVSVVLLSGWIKDKKGKSKREKNEVATAQTLLRECIADRGEKAK